MRISIITVRKIGKDPSTIPSFCLEDGRYQVKIYKTKKMTLQLFLYHIPPINVWLVKALVEHAKYMKFWCVKISFASALR